MKGIRSMISRTRIYKIVKKYVDAMDCYGLLSSGAPKDEFELESQKIANAISESNTALEIAEIMQRIFNQSFSSNDKIECFIKWAELIKVEL